MIWRLWPAVLFLLVLLAGLQQGMLGREWLLYYALASVLAAAVYQRDKLAARTGRWRTPERMLYLLGLAGGWPGGLLMRHLLRHKLHKPAFTFWFWLSAAANLLLAAALLDLS